MPHASSVRTQFSTFVLVTVALVSISCGESDEPAGDSATELVIPAVEVVQARSGALPLSERLTGTVRAAGEVAIYPQASGPVVEVFAQNGSAVKKGDPLVRIRAPGSQPLLEQARSNVDLAQAEVKQAEAALADIETRFKRAQVLGERGIVSVESVQTLRAEAETARATVAAARARAQAAQAAVDERAEVRGQLVVRAPISGLVGQRNVEVGMRVDPQSPLFVIGRLDAVRVEVPVTQEILARIRKDQRVEIDPGNDRPPIVAQVSRISPFLAAGSYSAEVEIDVPNESGVLVPGMFVPVAIFYGESEQATLIPTSALYDDPRTGQQGVFVLADAPSPADPAANDDGQGPLDVDPTPTRFRPVTVIAEGPQTLGVNAVQPGEWVVVVGQHLLAAQGATDAPVARVRIVAWERILELQGLQRHDLLRQFMEEQQRQASRVGGATPAKPGGSF